MLLICVLQSSFGPADLRLKLSFPEGYSPAQFLLLSQILGPLDSMTGSLSWTEALLGSGQNHS